MDDSIGFIGLGTMGGPMAANLLQAGKKLVVHDICPETAKPLCEQGATWADDITDMRKHADVIISSLPGPKEIEQVGVSANGLVDALGEGGLWIDTSTNSVSLAKRLATACEAAGGSFVDAPISGGVMGARQASLKIMAGGTTAAFTRARPILDVIGSSVIHTGAAGTGAAMKLVLNFLSITSTGLVAEALTLGRASGLTSETLLTVLNGSYGDSATLRDTIETANGSRRWEFANVLARKDVALAVEHSEAIGLRSHFGEVIVRLLDECLSDRNAPDDVFSLVEAYERRADVSIV